MIRSVCQLVIYTLSHFYAKFSSLIPLTTTTPSSPTPPPECRFFFMFLFVQAGIDRVNKAATSNAQRVQKWMVLPRDFSLPGGELGPTMKVRLNLRRRTRPNDEDKVKPPADN